MCPLAYPASLVLEASHLTFITFASQIFYQEKTLIDLFQSNVHFLSCQTEANTVLRRCWCLEPEPDEMFTPMHTRRKYKFLGCRTKLPNLPLRLLTEQGAQPTPCNTEWQNYILRLPFVLHSCGIGPAQHRHLPLCLTAPIASLPHTAHHTRLLPSPARHKALLVFATNMSVGGRTGPYHENQNCLFLA